MVEIDSISKAEAVKQQSRQLRGRLAKDLADTTQPFDKEGYSLLKFHGIYQGYDRDSATERKQRGDSKVWQFMVRVRIPGGRLTAAQYLALDALADRYANGSLRVTTRQSIQFHGVVKRGLKKAIAEINAALLTTLAACGDVVRTVTTVPVPLRDPVHRRLEDDARRLSTHLLPQTGAYHEIWLDGEKVTESTPDPLYGERYLPRKFKIGLAIPDDNTIDVLTNDLGIVALFDGDELSGYNFFLGGGHGMTHNNPATYPRLATPVVFVEPDDLLDAAAAVVRLHRDWGDRGNRRHARLKYIIAEQGEDWARERLSEDLGKELAPCRPMPALQVPDHLGWHEQGDGKWFLGLPIASGRIADDERSRVRTALREIVARFGCDPILMPSQDIILSEVQPQDRDEITSLLREHGVRLAEDMIPAERWALACPALPSCGLALTEAERVQGDIIGAIAARLRRWGLDGERISIRITGCPNGCARPYSGDIGIVGRVPGFYSLYVGGDFEGTRLNEAIADRLDIAGIADALDPLFALWASSRTAGEGFGDFCHRVGIFALQQVVSGCRNRAA
ncbi:MAG TPA: NADPH-dependent assimilatory sulfite reductase hemoprotein subunit [Stellaceae bacterium]|jgi:sulfite reductase (ferredoxin)|nr:NADPH-dependent assimilatory sulfite reductase hemoprotein subunit [Stellaceae bacterium]